MMIHPSRKENLERDGKVVRDGNGPSDNNGIAGDICPGSGQKCLDHTSKRTKGTRSLTVRC